MFLLHLYFVTKMKSLFQAQIPIRTTSNFYTLTKGICFQTSPSCIGIISACCLSQGFHKMHYFLLNLYQILLRVRKTVDSVRCSFFVSVGLLLLWLLLLILSWLLLLLNIIYLLLFLKHVHESHEITIEEAVKRVFKPKFLQKLTCDILFVIFMNLFFSSCCWFGSTKTNCITLETAFNDAAALGWC